jgi:endogenous inhibitor of DNA gyrase (YacG/DUF329 family)
MIEQCGIYRFYHTPTGTSYIGQSINIAGRIEDHKRALRDAKHLPRFQTFFEQSGGRFCDWDHEIVELCSPAELIERELYWIARLCPALNSIIAGPNGPMHLPPVEKPTLNRRECEMCGEKDALPSERYCRHCRSIALKRWSREGYLTPTRRQGKPRPMDAREAVHETKHGPWQR